MSFNKSYKKPVVETEDGTVIETEKTDVEKQLKRVEEAAKAVEKVVDEFKPEVSETPQVAKTKPDLTNIRAKSDPNSDIVKVVSKGAEFKVDQAKSTKAYVAVSVEGIIAYIKRELVEVFDNPAYKSHDSKKIG